FPDGEGGPSADGGRPWRLGDGEERSRPPLPGRAEERGRGGGRAGGAVLRERVGSLQGARRPRRRPETLPQAPTVRSGGGLTAPRHPGAGPGVPGAAPGRRRDPGATGST